MTIENIRAHDDSIRHTGPWTTSRRFDVRASSSSVVLDLPGWTGHRACRTGPRAKDPTRIDVGDRSAAGPDGVHVDHGDHRLVGTDACVK